MDRDRGFSFKLLVPPRVNSSQVSAVRPQENIENCGDFMNTPQQGTCSKYFDKEQTMALPITKMVAPTMPTKKAFTKMKVVSPMEKDETNCNHAQLFSKLFDEVEKIQCWKVQTDSETVQMERRLQENKRTIETQRKAIQELQFGNESLSMKLEEQISDNENLRNKDNATRNLFNILKDTFERSAEKIQLFESEREETHHLLMENSESVQKLFEAFESLRLQAVADQQEMQKAKEDLQQFESFKEKCHQEYNTVEKEVVVLKMQLKEKENEIQKLLLDLNEIQKQCKQLQDAADELSELLRTSKTEQESILQELNNTKQNHKETRKSLEATNALLEKSKEEYVKMIESKNVCLEELSRVKIQQAEKLEQIQATTLELQNALALEIKRAKELEDELSANNKELQRNKKLLEEAIDQSTQKSWQMKNLKDDLDKKSQSMECMQVKIDVAELRLTELKAELLRMTNEVQLIKNEAEIAFAENSALKTACQAAEIAKEDLRKKSTMAETEVQELVGQLLTEKQKNDEHTFQMEQMRQQIAQHEEKYKELLSNFNKLQSEKTDIQQQFENGSLNVKTIEANIKESEEKALKLRSEIQKLENENQHLRDEVGSITATVQEKYLNIENLQKEMEENCEHLENVIREKEEQIKAVETKLFNVRKKFDMKIKVQAEYQKENKVLKKQISKETSKSSHLENVMNSLHEECENLKRLNEEDHQKLFKDLESKSKVVAELSNEVERLRLTKAEAIKNKEETELKCQHKIADMVALMEKHKNQYDRIVEEKDAQLNEDKKKEVEAVAHLKSVVRDLEKHKTDNDKLKQQLKREVAEKENLQKELTDLKKDMSSMKVTLLSDIKSKQSPAPNYIQARSSETPNPNSSKRHVFDLSKTRKTPSYSKDEGIAEIVKKAECDAKAVQTPSGTTQKSKDFLKEDPKTPKCCNNGASGAAKIKSYRIRTPPSDLKAHWKKTSIELDFKSDSSDQSDILSFASAPAPQTSAGHCQLNISQKNPVNQKSPGNSLKVAAMKRMRDAGWAAVTGCDKRKKKTNEKIFA